MEKKSFKLEVIGFEKNLAALEVPVPDAAAGHQERQGEPLLALGQRAQLRPQRLTGGVQIGVVAGHQRVEQQGAEDHEKAPLVDGDLHHDPGGQRQPTERGVGGVDP